MYYNVAIWPAKKAGPTGRGAGVARTFGVGEAGGSNPLVPTITGSQIGCTDTRFSFALLIQELAGSQANHAASFRLDPLPVGTGSLARQDRQLLFDGKKLTIVAHIDGIGLEVRRRDRAEAAIEMDELSELELENGLQTDIKIVQVNGSLIC